MSMSFPDYASLRHAAIVHGFRQPLAEEAEEAYRLALAEYVEPRDFVESCEIRNKVGWDQFTEQQNAAMVLLSFLGVSHAAPHP